MEAWASTAVSITQGQPEHKLTFIDPVCVFDV